MSSKTWFTDTTQFPTDCTNEILSYLDLQSLGRFCRISKKCDVLGSSVDKLPKEIAEIAPKGVNVKKFFSQRVVLTGEEVLERIDSFLKKIKTNGIFRCRFPLVEKEAVLIIKIAGPEATQPPKDIIFGDGRPRIVKIGDRDPIPPGINSLDNAEQLGLKEFSLKEEYIFMGKDGDKLVGGPCIWAACGYRFIFAQVNTYGFSYQKEKEITNSLKNLACERVSKYVSKTDFQRTLQKLLPKIITTAIVIGVIAIGLGIGLASKQS